MTEHAEDPVGQASSKVVQYVSLATIAAEAIAQVRQQRTAAAATTDARAAAAIRAEHGAALAAARTQWAPVLDPRLREQTSVAAAGLAWAATQAWRDSDPEAGIACTRAEQRLRVLRPDVMNRYDRLTNGGVDPVEAMRRVAPFLDRPPAQPSEHGTRAAVAASPAGDRQHACDDALDTQSSAGRQHYIDTGRYLAPELADSSLSTAADTAARTADQEPGLYVEQAAATVGDPRTPGADEQPAAAAAGAPTLTRLRTAPQIAKDGFPEPLTGEVLAAGRVKPKAPATTAPAAVRSTGLATAARASGRAR